MDNPEDERRPLLPNDRPHNEAAAPSSRDGTSTSRRRSSTILAQPLYDNQYDAQEGRGEENDKSASSTSIWSIIPVLLLGVFVANADVSLVIASTSKISSEFGALSAASWLVTSFGLAQCASQPLYGKLSDLFGRKANLIVAHILFAIGCFVCGTGRTYSSVIAGRAISGVGGAGMTALVSLIITDTVPVRSIASWRSYVNIVATIGRSAGGPLGGWLADTIGWRWSFNGQVPLTFIGLLLVSWRVPRQTSKTTSVEQLDSSLSQRFRRIDVVGATILACTISAFLLTFDFAAKEVQWWIVAIVAAITVLGATFFYITEQYIAKEPILPLQLLAKRAAYTSYLLAGVQIAAQSSMFYSVPIYFQIAAGTSVTGAGLRLIPAVIGNAAGGLLSGWFVSRTGRYKLLTILASTIATAGYVLMLLRWHGDTNWLELSYFLFGGLGTGIIQSTMFVHLAASLEANDMAIAGTTLYLSQNVFTLIGIQLSTTIFRASLKAMLNNDLQGLKNKDTIIKDALRSIQSIRDLPAEPRAIVIRAHVNSMYYSYGLSIVFAFIGVILALTIREKKL